MANPKVPDAHIFDDAACKYFPPSLFMGILGFEAKPVRLEREAKAKEVCRGCKAKERCLNWALKNDPNGVWGETTREERRKMQSEQNS